MIFTIKDMNDYCLYFKQFSDGLIDLMILELSQLVVFNETKVSTTIIQ